MNKFYSKNIYIESLLILIISIIGIQYTNKANLYIDIMLWDETIYLMNGQTFYKQIYSPENGPLYSLWYFILHSFEPDNLKLYYLNWKILTWLPSVLFFILLRQSNINILLSFIFSITSIYSYTAISLSPRISCFCICLILLAIIISQIPKSLITKWTLLSIIALIASYIRPEFSLIFILSLLISIVLVVTHKFKIKIIDWISLSFIPISFLFLFIIFNGSAMSGDTNRSLAAFGQHFAFRYVKTNNLSIDSWINWETITKQNFDDCNSLWCCIKNRPDLFVHHCFINFLEFMNKIYVAILPDFLYPSNIFHLKDTRLLFWLLCYLLLFGSLFFINKTKVSSYIKLIEWNKCLIVFLFMIPVLISIIVIYPREHYIYLMVFPIIYLLFTFFKIPDFNSYKYSLPCIAMMLLLLAIYQPQIKSYYANDVYLPNQKAVYYLRKLNIKKEVHLLEIDGGIGIYIGKNFHWRMATHKNIPFNKFVIAQDANLIWANRFKNDASFYNDTTWLNFSNNPSKLGFTMFTIPKSSGEWYIKNDLLNN